MADGGLFALRDAIDTVTGVTTSHESRLNEDKRFSSSHFGARKEDRTPIINNEGCVDGGAEDYERKHRAGLDNNGREAATASSSEQREQRGCSNVVAESGDAGNGERSSEQAAGVAGQSPVMEPSVLEGTRQGLACCGLEEVPFCFLGGAEVT